MKNIFYLTLSALIMSCGNSTTADGEVKTEDLKDISADCDCAQIDFKRNAFGNVIEGSLVYDINTEKVFSGTCEEKFGDNSRKEIRQYSNGKLHGVIATWHENGNLRRHLNFINGKQHGEQVAWDENGKTVEKTTRDNDCYIGSGFIYEKGVLTHTWLILPTEKCTQMMFGTIHVSRGSINFDRDLSENAYSITLNQKMKDTEIIDFIKSLLDEHFSDEEKVQIDHTAWLEIPNIKIEYDVMGFESIGYLEAPIEAKGKEDERDRIAKLLHDNFPRLVIPGQ